jgi:hypothetical protein
MKHVRDAGADCVEGFERTDECARQEDLDLDAPPGRRVESRKRKTLGGGFNPAEGSIGSTGGCCSK